MAAFAIGKDTRGFKAFNRSHLDLAKIAAKQSPNSADRTSFWNTVCIVRELHPSSRVPLRLFKNPVYQKNSCTSPHDVRKHQPVEFMDRLPLLSRRLSRTGKLSSRFPVYDIVGEILYGEIPLIVEEKWVPWIEESLRGEADKGRRLELWTEISFDFVDICATYPAILESVSYLGRVWHKNPNPVAFAHDLGT
ncbi:hypothetical protein MPH_10136 [Macrophomina phaseolina MS6]|uniref:Uncharacterized protein n=1 Tax=Macrophomina phaseolina (strain MS6) TaxID=1126212 RepID=K2RDR4_MACPH|nr:hypothetical protein MPH_10136 [Macrophomina phaseolina MS6]